MAQGTSIKARIAPRPAKLAFTISAKISPNARIIWGCSVDPTIDKEVQLLLVITGVKSQQIIGSETAGDAPSGIDMFE